MIVQPASMHKLYLCCLLAFWAVALINASKAHGDTSADYKKAALLVIDVQNCFMPGGTLAVSDGLEVVPVINSLVEGKRFHLVAYTQDWHPPGHVSFASTYPNKTVGQELSLEYTEGSKKLCGFQRLFPPEVTTDCSEIPESQLHHISQHLWPDHCVANTTDANLHPDLNLPSQAYGVYKGFRVHVDAYSAFFDNGNLYTTVLHSILQQQGIQRLYVAGVALDYCVLWSSRDAFGLGYEVAVISDATRGVSPDSSQAALQEFKRLGIRYISSEQVMKELRGEGETATQAMQEPMERMVEQ